MEKKQTTQETLISNLVLLMQRHGYSVRDIAGKSGLSGRMVRYVLNGERLPTIETAEQLARCFNLSGWQLIMPSLMDYDGDLSSLSALINDYLRSDDEGRQFISSAAKRESSRKAS